MDDFEKSQFSFLMDKDRVHAFCGCQQENLGGGKPQKALYPREIHAQDPRTENSPHLGFIYTSFQERETFISHGNTARLAKEHGDIKLAQICGTIAADEKRHETAYYKIVEKLFEIDGTVLAFADMMKKKISMPAHLMYDGCDDNLFEHFSAATQQLGVYTAKDCSDILEFLVGRWKMGDLTGLSPDGREAQDYVCGLPPRIKGQRRELKDGPSKHPASLLAGSLTEKCSSEGMDRTKTFNITIQVASRLESW